MTDPSDTPPFDPFASSPLTAPRPTSQRPKSFRKSMPPNLNAPLPPLPPDELEFEPTQLNPHIISTPRTTNTTRTHFSPFQDDDPMFEIRRSMEGGFEDDLEEERYRMGGYGQDGRLSSRYSGGLGIGEEMMEDPFADEDAIPLTPQYPKMGENGYSAGRNGYGHERGKEASLPPPPPPPVEDRRRRDRSSSSQRRKYPFFSRHTPWVTYTLTVIQVVVFIAEIIKNGILTGTPIEIHPSFNPMIGPSPYVLINMGARYVPCMRNQQGVQNANETIYWPCPNTTDASTAACTLSQLCGFDGVPNPAVNGSLDAVPAPNQWFRFITPIFLHAGIVHIGFNMLLQVLLGGDMERIIGHIRFFLVYFASGIFGFILGGNFAPSGIASTGASGALFGIIAILLLDLLYTWPTRRSPWKDLAYILLDIAISFVLGLLPGVDNFSHIGGFIMGLLLGIALLRSPQRVKRVQLPTEARERGRTGVLSSRDPGADGVGEGDAGSAPNTPRRKPTNKFSPLPPLPPQKSGTGRDSVLTASPRASPFAFSRDDFKTSGPLHIFFLVLRLAALVGALVVLVLGVRGFYAHHDTECHWCRYLSCLPIRDWCEVGDLFNTQ